LLGPGGVLYTADVVLTLVGQPAAYWAGNYGSVVEFNPIAYQFLAAGPVWCLLAAVVWLLLLGAVVLAWRHPVTDWIAYLLALGHAVGGSSWLVRFGGWPAAIAYLAVAAAVSRWCWRRGELGTAHG
jgi:hypothetical protein